MTIEKKEYINVPFEVKEFDEDDEYFQFEGYASTFGNVDLGNDRVLPGAFKDCLERLRREGKQLPILWQHDMKMPLGVYFELYEDDKGLFVKGRMPKADDFVRGRVMPQMKAKSISAMSIGYVATDWKYNDSVRDLIKVELLETSLVTMPMNPKADITGMKGATTFQDLPLADDATEWNVTDAINRVRTLTDSEESPSAQYKRAFFWYDADDAESYGAYKLPYADVIDGELRAVPRAIFAAAAAMRGARGGVSIPDSDRAAVEAHINRYYEKMDRESPLKEKSFYVDSDSLKFVDKRELESILSMGNVKFSKPASKKLSSCLDVDSVREARNDVTRDAKKSEDEQKLATILENMGKAHKQMEKLHV